MNIPPVNDDCQDDLENSCFGIFHQDDFMEEIGHNLVTNLKQSTLIKEYHSHR